MITQRSSYYKRRLKKCRVVSISFKRKKIKSIPLKVSAPFHCSLMKPAADAMKDKIKNINFEKPNFEIVSNVTANPENNPENIKNVS